MYPGHESNNWTFVKGNFKFCTVKIATNLRGNYAWWIRKTDGATKRL